MFIKVLFVLQALLVLITKSIKWTLKSIVKTKVYKDTNYHSQAQPCTLLRKESFLQIRNIILFLKIRGRYTGTLDGFLT